MRIVDGDGGREGREGRERGERERSIDRARKNANNPRKKEDVGRVPLT